MENDFEDVALMIIKRGNFKSNHVDNDMNTALSIALEKSMHEIYTAFIREGNSDFGN